MALTCETFYWDLTFMTNDEKTNGMLCHLLAFSGLIGLPFGNILGPLIIWLIKKNESEFVDACGKASLNFQISLTIYAFISGLLVLVFVGIIGLVILFILMIVCVIKASIKANEGEFYEYPYTIKFIK